MQEQELVVLTRALRTMLDALEAHVVLGNRLPEALAAELHRAPVLLNSAGVGEDL